MENRSGTIADSLREVRKKVGMVFQNSRYQLFAPTVYPDVAFGPLNLGMEPDEESRRSFTGHSLKRNTGFENRQPHRP